MKKAKLVTAEEAPKRFLYDIRAIYIRKSSIALDDDFNPLISGQELSAAFECKQNGYVTSGAQEGEGATENIQSITCLNRFDFAYLLTGQQVQKSPTDAPEQKIAASITASICVDYVVNGAQPTPEELAAIANSSVLHSWPYWREYCHSNMTRMQLPVVQVPLLHIQTAEVVSQTIP